MEKGHHGLHKLSAAGLLVTLGIIYGDIGTSPLYVLNAIIGKNPIDSDIIKGAISCIFWTLTLQTTIKYVIITLRADNNGEGGIFSLYALIRKTKIKWLLLISKTLLFKLYSQHSKMKCLQLNLNLFL